MSNVDVKCPKCGESIQVDDQREEAFCSYCGSKMVVRDVIIQTINDNLDEAQRIAQEIIDGTSNDGLNDLYVEARKAKDADEVVLAGKLYSEILEKDPNNWESNFYAVYFKARNSSIADMPIEASNVKESILLVTALLAQKYNSDSGSVSSELTSIITELSSKLTVLTKNYYNHAAEFLELCDMSDDFDEQENDHCDICAQCALIMYAWSMCLEEYWGDKFGSIIAQSYATGIEHHKRLAERMKTEADFIHQKSEMFKYAEKAKKYNPNYTIGTINRKSRRNANASNYNRASNNYSGTNNTSPQSNYGSDGGCYIATAVYGSYDCPEVWTLRRFRDYTLYESWYGRAFIKAYYAISPTLVKWFGKTQWFKKSWSAVLDRFVAKLNNDGVANTPYNDRQF